jgi:hypothetical protein
MRIGMNLESVVDWSPAWTFTDAFQTSRPWISHAYNTVTFNQTWEGGGPVAVDAKGWPTQLNQFTNAQGQPIQQRLGTLMFGNGVALEYMIALANELDADPWFNMPYQADDGFVRAFATLVRDQLEPGRTAYIEWSNETWNAGWGFETFAWVTDQLQRPENADLNGDRWALVARETRRDFGIWSEVFAGQSNRIVRVVAGQQANSWIAGQIASNMGGQFDAISAAAYAYVSDADRASFRATTTADPGDTPQIGVETVVAAASESGPASGSWRISRSGNTSAPLAVNFTLGGSATAADYTGIPSSLSFAAGEATKLVTLMPIDDTQVEGAEQAVFTLVAGTGYTIDAARASGTVTIADNDAAPVQGLRGSYYDNRDFTGLKFTRIAPNIDFNWGVGSPDARIAKDTFSVRWQGQVKAIESGKYTLRTLSDDGVRVRVGGILRINNWTNHLATYNTSSTFNLAAGQRVDLLVDYYDNSGASTIRLEWKRPGSTSFVAIPTSQLFPPSSAIVKSSNAANGRSSGGAEGEATEAIARSIPTFVAVVQAATAPETVAAQTTAAETVAAGGFAPGGFAPGEFAPESDAPLTAITVEGGGHETMGNDGALGDQGGWRKRSASRSVTSVPALSVPALSDSLLTDSSLSDWTALADSVWSGEGARSGICEPLTAPRLRDRR